MLPYTILYDNWTSPYCFTCIDKIALIMNVYRALLSLSQQSLMIIVHYPFYSVMLICPIEPTTCNHQVLFHSMTPLLRNPIAFMVCCPCTLHSVLTFCFYILYFTFCTLYHCVITIRTLDQIKSKSLSLSLSLSLAVSLSSEFSCHIKWMIVGVDFPYLSSTIASDEAWWSLWVNKVDRRLCFCFQS